MTIKSAKGRLKVSSVHACSDNRAHDPLSLPCRPAAVSLTSSTPRRPCSTVIPPLTGFETSSTSYARRRAALRSLHAERRFSNAKTGRRRKDDTTHHRRPRSRSQWTQDHACCAQTASQRREQRPWPLLLRPGLRTSAGRDDTEWMAGAFARRAGNEVSIGLLLSLSAHPACSPGTMAVHDHFGSDAFVAIFIFAALSVPCGERRHFLAEFESRRSVSPIQCTSKQRQQQRTDFRHLLPYPESPDATNGLFETKSVNRVFVRLSPFFRRVPARLAYRTMTEAGRTKATPPYNTFGTSLAFADLLLFGSHATAATQLRQHFSDNSEASSYQHGTDCSPCCALCL